MRSPTHSTVRLEIACDRASKSNIKNSHSVATSAEAVGAVEETLDVHSDGLFQRGEAAIVAGALQPIDLTLGEILVAAANRLRHVDILDIGSRAERGIGGNHHILEAARGAGADIEETTDRRDRKQPHHHPRHVVDIDEIAALIAVGDAFAM